MAGQRVRGEGREQQGHTGHVFGGGELAVDGLLEHDLLDHVVLTDTQRLGLLRDLLLHQRRTDKAGADHIGAHAVFGAFLGDRLGQTDQAVLGRHIGCLEQRGFLAVHRAHVDDAAPAALRIHVLDTGLGGEEGAVEVDGQHLLPVRELELFHRMNDLDARIADQDVDAAKGRHAGFNAGVDLLFVRHVHGNANGLPAAGLDFGGGRVSGGLVQVRDHDLGAFLGEHDGDLLADAAGRAGDVGDFVFQLHASSP